MIHRFVHNVLTAGVIAITADLSLLDDLFNDYLLTAKEIAMIKTLWGTKPLNVINGYARRDTDFPAVAIVLAGENEAVNFIGDDAPQIEDEEDPYNGADVESAIWAHNYHLFIYTGHPDVTAYYYEIVKGILLAGLDTLTEKDCFEYKFSGMDLAPDPGYLPDNLYARQMVFGCQREFQRVDRASLAGKGTSVAGMHVDSSGRAGDVDDLGDVKTNITPYTEGEQNE